jgi:hypothetical protein
MAGQRGWVVLRFDHLLAARIQSLCHKTLAAGQQFGIGIAIDRCVEHSTAVHSIEIFEVGASTG